MNLNELARRAGFHVNESDVFSPHRKEKVSAELSKLLDIIEEKVLVEVNCNRPGQYHHDAIQRLFASLRN